ncbi:MAG: hypothetical protein ISQ82_01325 [Rhodobacteraceae bacterium]|nr:hypothetical protein [Paracoccaceae bacterium]
MVLLLWFVDAFRDPSDIEGWVEFFATTTDMELFFNGGVLLALGCITLGAESSSANQILGRGVAAGGLFSTSVAFSVLGRGFKKGVRIKTPLCNCPKLLELIHPCF